MKRGNQLDLFSIDLIFFFFFFFFRLNVLSFLLYFFLLPRLYIKKKKGWEKN